MFVCQCIEGGGNKVEICGIFCFLGNNNHSSRGGYLSGNWGSSRSRRCLSHFSLLRILSWNTSLRIQAIMRPPSAFAIDYSWTQEGAPRRKWCTERFQSRGPAIRYWVPERIDPVPVTQWFRWQFQWAMQLRIPRQKRRSLLRTCCSGQHSYPDWMPAPICGLLGLRTAGTLCWRCPPNPRQVPKNWVS